MLLYINKLDNTSLDKPKLLRQKKIIQPEPIIKCKHGKMACVGSPVEVNITRMNIHMA